MIAEFVRASERSRVIAADFDLDDTRAHSARRCQPAVHLPAPDRAGHRRTISVVTASD
ncbi:hypothetical protein [Qaidamihabitans albus]|uniref:hypothetical protein n=1 Tax=Qaidamihabitans albus TaxID=2795733 RepID=UPI0035565291